MGKLKNPQELSERVSCHFDNNFPILLYLSFLRLHGIRHLIPCLLGLESKLVEIKKTLLNRFFDNMNNNYICESNFKNLSVCLFT